MRACDNDTDADADADADDLTSIKFNDVQQFASYQRLLQELALIHWDFAAVVDVVAVVVSDVVRVAVVAVVAVVEAAALPKVFKIRTKT